MGGIETVCVELRYDSLSAESPLSVIWPGAERPVLRAVGAAEVSAVEARHRGLAPVEARYSESMARLRVDVGEALASLIDGPERALESALVGARRRGVRLRLVVRLVGPRGEVDAHHPGAAWRWELLALERRHLFRDGGVGPELVVQLGDRDVGPATALPTRALRILFMAYSPEGVQPELEYEAEEDRLLAGLQEHIQDGRVRLSVVEDGSLDGLRRRLSTGKYDIVHFSPYRYRQLRQCRRGCRRGNTTSCI
ncbi:MAG: hypothetical protein HUU55_18775 [Myxococcales bacterium]|nr:hypothetical protein [Myxococcales bacterium]